MLRLNLLDPAACLNNTAIVTATGGLQFKADNWVTGYIPMIEDCASIVSSKYVTYMACYDEGKTFLGVKSADDTVLLTGTVYVRLQYAKTNAAFEHRDSMMICLPSKPQEYVPYYALNRRRIAADIADYSVRAIGSLLFSFALQTPVYMADHTFIGNELYVINSSADDHASYKPVTVYEVDLNSKTATYVRTFNHNIGHANTIDYCAGNDTLILGNGSSNASLPGKIFLLPGASQKETWEYDDCIVIDVSDEGWGIKTNVVWGEHNDENYNIAYVITNNNATVHKILLTKTDGVFDGGYLVLGEWNAGDGIDVNQGTVYHDGKLWAAIGHSQLWVMESQLLSDGTIAQTQLKDLFYDPTTGDVCTTPFSEGITIKDGHLFLGGSDGKIRVYKLGSFRR